TGGRGGRPRKRIGGQWLPGGPRASVLVLIGGLVVYVGLPQRSQLPGPASLSFDQVVDLRARGPGLRGDLILAALALRGPCGAALALGIGSVWFLVRRAVAPDSDSSPHP